MSKDDSIYCVCGDNSERKCKKAVVYKDKESQTVYTCGKNGGVCDITTYRFCTGSDKNDS